MPELQKQIQTEIARQLKTSQYSISQTNVHKHSGTGTDGPQISFLNLKDTPKSYYSSGNPSISLAGASVIVNEKATGLIFNTLNKGYSGSIGNAGSSVFLPTGWTSSKTGTGNYQVTHNLGMSNYSVTANAISAAPASDTVIGIITSIGANSFAIAWLDSTGASTFINTAFNFILQIQT